jgi:hypothetical protein
MSTPQEAAAITKAEGSAAPSQPVSNSQGAMPWANDMKVFEGKLEEMRKELAKGKIEFVEFCGIFVAIFTFISIEIQIFRWICDFYKLIGFTLIFGSSLLGFIFVLDFLINNSNKWIEGRRPSSYAVKFVVIGALLISMLWIGFNQIAKGSTDSWRCSEEAKSPSIEKSPTNTYQFPSTVNLRLSQ